MAPTSYYIWGADGVPVSVLISSAVMDEINGEIAAAKSVDSRPWESGGILLGTVNRAAARPTVRIEKLDPIEAEHRRGPSFTLTDRDKWALGKRLANWNSRRDRSLRPVGFYRTHTRRGLYLDNDDFGVIRMFFPQRESVVLLVRPEVGAANAGGFFFWKSGDMHRESSLLEFPFDPARLPLVSPPPPVLPQPAPAPAASASRRNWLRAGVPIAAALVLGLTVYGVRALSNGRQTRPVNHPVVAAQPVLMPAPVVRTVLPPVDKPSPARSKETAQAPRPTMRAPDRNPPPAVEVEPSNLSHAEVTPEPPSTQPPPPAPAMASIDVPVRTAPRQRPSPQATVTIEPVGDSKIGRFVGKIPGLRRLEKKKRGFVPARPIHEVAPSVPGDHELERAVPVDLRVTVDPAGNVASVEPARGADRQLVRLATDAARSWRFEPARRNEETVASELILHFTFRPPNELPPDVAERP